MAGGMEVIFQQPLRAVRVLKKTQDSVERAISQGAFAIERSAKRRAATNYGILRGAIQALKDSTSLAWTVGARGLRHAKFIEFGTGPAGAASPKIGALARQAMAEAGYAHGSGGRMPSIDSIRLWAQRKGVPDDLIYPIARAIGFGSGNRRAGIPAQPFLLPSYEEERPKIIANIRRAIRSSFGLK